MISLWLVTCYPVCNKAEGFDWFLYWILALNCIIGGLIGGLVVIFKIIGIAVELVKIVAENFWTKSPKAGI